MRAIPALAASLACIGAASAETPVERGKYLVTLSGCNDCHTPGGLIGQPDAKRRLGGSDVGFGDPASGVWVGGNLTPDKQTGLGKWTTREIVAANSSAAQFGLQKGDVIVELNGTPIRDTHALVAATAARVRLWDLTISRGGQTIRTRIGD